MVKRNWKMQKNPIQLKYLQSWTILFPHKLCVTEKKTCSKQIKIHYLLSVLLSIPSNKLPCFVQIHSSIFPLTLTAITTVSSSDATPFQYLTTPNFPFTLPTWNYYCLFRYISRWPNIKYQLPIFLISRVAIQLNRIKLTDSSDFEIVKKVRILSNSNIAPL